jgi:hypothetical protein
MDDGETEAEPAGDILPPEEEEITGTWPLRSMASLTPMNMARPPLVKLYPVSLCMLFGNALVERPFGVGHSRVLARDERL